MNEPYSRGLALLRAGHEHEATACLREAVSLEPGNARARYHLALAHRLRGELTEARAELLAALDGLHQEAHREVHGEPVPMPPVVELHGTLLETRCHACDARPGRTAGSYVGTSAPRPPRCERCGGPLRPDVVLFGERVAPERMGQALELVGRCDALLVVGTAMDVAPASELPRIARANGVPVVELKRTASRLSRSLDTVLVPGESDVVLPELLEALRRTRGA